VSLKLSAPGSRFSAGTRTASRRMSACQTRARGALARDHRRLVPGAVGLDEEALDLAVLVRARPHHDDVRDRAVPDPALRAVDDIGVAVAVRARLERDRIRPVVGLGQREGADLVEARHRLQPALLLLLRAEHRDRLHRQAGLNAEAGPEAPVAAVKLHRHQARGQRAHAGAAVAVDVLADQLELGEAHHERPWQLGALPVVVDRPQEFLVDQAPGADEPLPLLVAELLAHEEVVSGERPPRWAYGIATVTALLRALGRSAPRRSLRRPCG
jgi:hypothetical protein